MGAREGDVDEVVPPIFDLEDTFKGDGALVSTKMWFV